MHIVLLQCTQRVLRKDPDIRFSKACVCLKTEGIVPVRVAAFPEDQGIRFHHVPAIR